MGKAGKLRKRKRLEEDLVGNKAARTQDDDSSSDDDNSQQEDDGAISTDVLVAIKVLDALSRRLDLYDGKAYKGLRVALSPLLQLQQTKFFEAPGKQQLLSDKDVTQIISAKSLLITAAVAKRLSANVAEFSSDRHKPFRKALHPLVTHTYQRGSKAGKAIAADTDAIFAETLTNKNSISNVVSNCFRTGDYTGALAALYSLTVDDDLDSHMLPRLGSLQRWVRDCDVASLALSSAASGNVSQDLGELSLLLLHAVLRVTNLVKTKHSSTVQDPDRENANKKPLTKTSTAISCVYPYARAVKHHYDEVVVRKAHHRDLCLTEDELNSLIAQAAAESSGLREHLAHRGAESSLNLNILSRKRKPLAGCCCALRSAEEFYRRVSIISHVPGPQRRPPVAHDLNIFGTAPQTIAFGPHNITPCDQSAEVRSAADKCPEHPHMAPTVVTPTRHDIPDIPGAMLLSGVLSPLECAQFIVAAERMGYTPDSVDGIDNVVWLGDVSLMAPLYERVRTLLPPMLEGHVLMGVNARLRLFRYYQQAEYRPHIDGAWPGSGLLPDGTYTDDAFNGESHSRLTFLVYLNDGFEGGTTTFFLPGVDVPPSVAECAEEPENSVPQSNGQRPGRVGRIEVRKVQPQLGAVLVFPHGSASGSLVHEGSAVTRGVKYVIRTDVLYSSKPLAL